MAVDKVEKVIYSVLANDGNVSGLVATRIYPMLVPQGVAMPAIVYEQLTGPREHTMDGPFGMAGPVFNINCWSASYSQARTLADYVRIALDGYKGTVGTIKIYGAFLNNEADLREGSPDVKGTERFGKQLTFAVWFEEAIA